MSENTIHPKYRPDIDGLRAIAVLAVVIYHAFPSDLTGGFAGVDTFFVISGFLISTILFQNIDRGSFSIGDFYSRRIRRIFPALAIVLISVLIFGSFCLFPHELKQLGKHTASSAGFIQNFTLWKEAGYFDNASETKPLLHIWSLGIEEQFYFLWPLLLWGAGYLGKVCGGGRYKRFFYLFATVLVFLISFILNLKSIHVDPTKTFYLPQYRFFEMALGGILSWWVLYQPKISLIFIGDKEKFWPQWLTENKLKNFFSLIGLLILIDIFVEFKKETVFPGKNALLPIFGTAFIIWAGPHSWLNRKILSHKVLVWFGLISYPLYLWHWPILSFARIINGEMPPAEFRILAVVVSIFFSWLTIKIIEKPFRFGNSKIPLKLATLCLLVFGVGVFGNRIHKNTREPVSSDSQKETERIIVSGIENCKKEIPEWSRQDQYQDCLLQSSAPTIASIGDSHSGQLSFGMVDQLKKTTKSFSNFPSACTTPLIDVQAGDEVKEPFRINAHKMKKMAFDFIEKTKSIQTVFLAHNPDCSYDHGLIMDIQNPQVRNSEKILRKGLERTLNFLESKSKNVVIILDNPTFPFDPARCSPRGEPWDSLKNSICEIEIDSPSRDRYKKIVNEVVSKGFPKVKVLDLATLFCHSGKCSPVQNGKNLYNDSTHLNPDGSVYVAPYLIKAVE